MERKRKKHKKGGKNFNVIIPLVVYPFDVMVSAGETDEALSSRLKNYNIEGDEGIWKFGSDSCMGRASIFPGNQTLIRLRFFPDIPLDYGHLSHEIFHVVTFIMERVGMELCVGKNDEAYAYLIQYLTTEIMTVVGKVHRGEKFK